MVSEGLTLQSGKLELERGWLAGSIGGSEGSSAPWGATVDFRKVGELRECLGISERNEDD